MPSKAPPSVAVSRERMAELGLSVAVRKRRPGGGRKPNGARSGVPHLKRPRLGRHHPVHVTLRLERGLPNLRVRRYGQLLIRAFARARERLGMRVVHFSIQSNHLHLIVEASNRQTLARGMQGLGVRLAKRLNAAMGRRGRVFSDRYHSRILKTPLQVRRCLLYVLNNHRRHLKNLAPHWMDPFSSSAYFDGFRESPVSKVGALGFATRDPPVTQPRTWLLRSGWRRHGLLELHHTPKAGFR